MKGLPERNPSTSGCQERGSGRCAADCGLYSPSFHVVDSGAEPAESEGESVDPHLKEIPLKTENDSIRGDFLQCKPC